MSSNGLDPSIIQDFLTESGELLEQLESDLVVLERTPEDLGLINRVFRALHTIKGSASFLALGPLVETAHAAESALNAARNQRVRVDGSMMNLLLHAVDTLKRHMSQLTAGEELSPGDPAVVSGLAAIGEGEEATATSTQAAATVAESDEPAARAQPGRPAVTPLNLPPSKADLIPFLIADLDETLEKVWGKLPALASVSTRRETCGELGEACDALARAVDFFEFEPLTSLARALGWAVEALRSIDDRHAGQVLPRCAAVIELLRRHSAALKAGTLVTFCDTVLLSRLAAFGNGTDAGDDAWLPADADLHAVLRHDGVDAASEDAPAVGAMTAPRAASSAPSADSKDHPEDKPDTKRAEQTIRVEVGRLETLMNLVGELVLQKNRIAALTRSLPASDAHSQTLRESMGLAAGGLDRVTADIQVAVMRTRMQPLEKLFGRYPRLIRDLAQKTGKRIDLVIEGGETEVDKSVIEELGDPLVHLLRNAADHGIEPPADRLASGKAESGTIRLIASHEGSHVRVVVRDDGRGLIREKIARKAIERGLTTAETVAQLSDRQVFDFIFLPGFSTAEQVSDLSGRGVGMDVVRTNVVKLKGTIEVSSEPGKGTSVAITIPLTVAILPAMMVGVGRETYAVPLTNILEIVKPQGVQVSSIGGGRVMRLRDSVLPLVSAAELFGLHGSAEIETPFAVVLQMGDRRAGLLVSRLIGQQEIVVKALDTCGEAEGPVSGATVRDDGGVSLIVDVAQLLSLAEGSASAAEAHV